MPLKAQTSVITLLEQMAAAGEEGADLIVHHGEMPAHQVAERLDVPAVPVFTHPNSHFLKSLPHPHAPVLWRKAPLFQAIEAWRNETLKLPPRPDHLDPLRTPDGRRPTAVAAFSTHAIPQKLDIPSWVRITGYWFLPAPLGWQPPQQLRDFLSNGVPPVYVGFGSAVGSDPERTARIIAEALQLADVRAVVATGWGGITPHVLEGNNVLLVDQIPHDWLLPQMAAIVHHGGAGTTAAALAAGRPQVVCPFWGDEPMWARWMNELGVAPSPQPHNQLTPNGLANAIDRAITDPIMASRATELSQHIRAENGATKAVDVLESV